MMWYSSTMFTTYFAVGMLIPFKPRIINVKIITMYCTVVLVFAINEVTIENPFFSITILKPVTNKSLNRMRPTIQNSIIPRSEKDINAEETKILSASGSRNLPSAVTWLYFLA